MSLATGTFKAGTLQLKLFQWLEGMVLRRADAITVVGGKQKEWLVHGKGVEEDKVFVVPNGVDVQRFRPDEDIRGTDTSSNRGKVIVFVKALTEQSGVRHLVQSLPMVRERHPGTRLVLIGTGPLAAEIDDMIDRSGLKGAVECTGRLPNERIPERLNDADIFVLPSVPQENAEESFSISLLEAMACAKPVIASAIGGPKEIIEGGQDIGVLVPPGDPRAIADAVISLLDDPSRARRIGENARRHVASTFAWDRACEAFCAIYSEVLEGRPKPPKL